MDEFEALKEQLRRGFYERLLVGKINEAKVALKFILKSFREINAFFPQQIEDLKEIDEALSNELRTIWQNLENKMYCLQALAEKELNIPEEEVKADLNTWKDLFIDAFKEIIDTEIALINRINVILQEAEAFPKKEPLPKYKYSPKYAKQKDRDNLYSQHKEKIDNVELKILRHVRDSMRTGNKLREIQGISGKIKTGDWAGHYHADLPYPMGDHRIVYSWNGQIVHFEIMGTHKELGIAD